MKVAPFVFLSIFLLLFAACSQTNTVSNQMTSEDTSQKVVSTKQQTETIVTTITLNETNVQGETLKKDSIVEKEIPSTPQKNDYINLWISPQDPLYFTTLDSVKHEVHLTKANDQACTMSVDGQEFSLATNEYKIINKLYVKVREINTDSGIEMNTCYLGLKTVY